ncbi:hypothetical protein NDU88_003381, partial [Pleurodeles waltl]
RQLTTQRKQLWALNEDKVEYALLRTKQTIYAGGNRAGRLLAHRHHTQAKERRVAELRLSDGTLICQEELIHQQFERFFSDLYSVEGIDHKGVEDYLDSVPVPQLPPMDSATLENDITPTEDLASIHQLQPVVDVGRQTCRVGAERSAQDTIRPTGEVRVQGWLKRLGGVFNRRAAIALVPGPVLACRALLPAYLPTSSYIGQPAVNSHQPSGSPAVGVPPAFRLPSPCVAPGPWHLERPFGETPKKN